MFNKIISSQYSSANNTSHESECSSKSGDDILDLTKEKATTMEIQTSPSEITSTSSTSSPARSFYKRVIRTSLLLSMLSNATASNTTVKASSTNFAEFMKKLSDMFLKLRNINCLAKGLLNLGEENLISHGVNIRSAIKNSTNTSLEEIMSETFKLRYNNIIPKMIDAHGSNYDEANITVIDNSLSSVKKILLDACEKIQSITDFDSITKSQLNNTSTIIRADDTSYIYCPYTSTRTSATEHVVSQSMDRTIVTTIILVIVLSILCLLVVLMMKARTPRRHRNNEQRWNSMLEMKSFRTRRSSNPTVCLPSENNFRVNNDTISLIPENECQINCEYYSFGNDVNSLEKETSSISNVSLLVENKLDLTNKIYYLDDEYPCTSEASTRSIMVSSMTKKDIRKQHGSKIKKPRPKSESTQCYRSLDPIISDSSDSEIDD